jgi:RNA polymerase sigma-70 factor (ECF subfamily)
MTLPDPDDSTSLSLLERVSNADECAWDRLVKLYGPLAHHWCRRAGLPPDEAADVLQDVFSTVFQKIKTFRHDGPSSSFRAWLRAVTRSKVIDHFRKDARRPRARGGSTAWHNIEQIPAMLDTSEGRSLSESRSSLEVEDAESERMLLFRRGLKLIQQHFTEPCWQAFWRTTVDERAAAEVGAELGMSAEAVRQAKRRVLRRFRREYADLLELS